ncbi:MAG: hypothetical protein V3R16_09610 [Nitrospirales bacterium]
MRETIRDLAITAAAVAVALAALARPLAPTDRYVVDRIEGTYAVLISDRDMSSTDVLLSRFSRPVFEGMAILLDSLTP